MTEAVGVRVQDNKEFLEEKRMNETFWLKWKIIEQELKQIEPKCTCEGGRKHPEKTYHYANCPYLQFWDEHFQNVYSAMCTTLEAFLK